MRFALVTRTRGCSRDRVCRRAVSFEVADHGDSVEVIAHNVEAEGDQRSRRCARASRFRSSASRSRPRDDELDATVLFAEFDGIEPRAQRQDQARSPRSEDARTAREGAAGRHRSPPHVPAPRRGRSPIAPTPVISTHAASPAPGRRRARSPISSKRKPRSPRRPRTRTRPSRSQRQSEARQAVARRPTRRFRPTSERQPVDSPGLYGVGALVTLLACGYLLKKRKKDAAAVVDDRHHRAALARQQSEGDVAVGRWPRGARLRHAAERPDARPMVEDGDRDAHVARAPPRSAASPASSRSSRPRSRQRTRRR